MCTCEETAKSQLGEIRDAMSKISSLRSRAVYLRKVSQENHVKRMQLARSMGEHLSPVFILPSNSPVREPKRSQDDSPTKLKSPNKTATTEDKQVEDKTFHKCKIMSQKNETVLKTSAPDGRKNASKVKDDKINAKHCKPNEINKITVKSTLSLAKFSKREKSKRKETEKKLIKNKVRKDKAPNKKSPKKISIFYSQSPTSVPVDLEKEDDNACAVNCDDVVNSPKQMSPHESSKPEEAAENGSDKTSSKHELSNSLNKLNVEETKRKDTQNNKILNAAEGGHSLKRAVKKKNKGLPKYKTNPVKSSQNKEKKTKESKNKDILTYANKTDRPIKVYPNTVLTTIAKKDSSVLSHSMSVDSLEDLRKTLKEAISPASRTIDKVRNFINDKKDLMTSTSLENDSQREKMADNTEKQHLKPYGLVSGSKIPVHEFRTYQTRSNEKVNEILGESFQDKYRIKDKECFADGCNENTDGILPLINPFKSKKYIVNSWLKNVPDIIQKNEKTGKKTREFIPNSINFITASNTGETRKQTISKNGTYDFPENRKQISPSSKSFNYSPGNKTPDSDEPDSAAISSTVSISLSSSVPLTESEVEERKRSTVQKNNLGPLYKPLFLNFQQTGKDYSNKSIQ
ncbi:hypothetical protein AVEN_48168-1 [Araneus ventricosus]|uniref:Uncharacterized protein n=1 Tax=Araneus ventricosus TaxID=182803 RepID=A0A4Y2IJK6_ARAVE|nr:hypothetical protein AVEN_48168-1 [Araneus ventricosus]